MTEDNQRTPYQRTPSDSKRTPPASELDTPPAVLSQFTYTVRRGLQRLNEASARIGRGMESSIESVNESMESLGEHVDGTTAMLDANMEAIEDTNRRPARSLEALTPVLERLSGPMEVKLVPQIITPPRHPSGGDETAEE